MTHEPWRVVCPRGHTTWTARSGGYYCQPCDTVHGRLLDKKTGESVKGGVVG